MRGVEDGKQFEKEHIKDNKSLVIEINKDYSNGHNIFADDSYLNSKYFMIKIYENRTVLNTRVAEHKKGIGQGTLMSVEITETKMDDPLKKTSKTD